MVKTAASHAVNIGSNPVRVTSDSSQMSQNCNATSRIAQSVTLLVVSIRDRCAGSLMVRERIDSAAHRFRSQPLRWVVRGERRENSKIALDKWKKRSIIEMLSGQPDDSWC